MSDTKVSKNHALFGSFGALPVSPKARNFLRISTPVALLRPIGPCHYAEPESEHPRQGQQKADRTATSSGEHEHLVEVAVAGAAGLALDVGVADVDLRGLRVAGQLLVGGLGGR
jgi:hypothetical protein